MSKRKRIPTHCPWCGCDFATPGCDRTPTFDDLDLCIACAKFKDDIERLRKDDNNLETIRKMLRRAKVRRPAFYKQVRARMPRK